ncbi:MAG: tRNA uridine-5-carboxymethylaminomethyl(34) synthesis GTPase MnmE [Pseudomonadota bacterium]
MDTIFARATAPGKAGVAIVRVSGPAADKCLATFGIKSVPPYRYATLCELLSDGRLLDQALILRFEAGHSFTGESVVELQVHGSPAVVDQMLLILGNVPGYRLAEPGEFTHRALLNNRLDVTQVEALADLIDAETEEQRRQAITGFSGVFSDRIEGWRMDLLRAAALMEATIDFAEEDVPVDVFPEVGALIDGLLLDWEREIGHVNVAERIRNGFTVAIVGQPNVGKSTLLNRIAQRDVAITSKLAGTTRDVLEVRLDLEGLPVTLLDTAGIRESSDEIEAAGIERAVDRAKAADLRIFLGPLAREDLKLNEDICVDAKADLTGLDPGSGVSGLTGHGVSELLSRIVVVLRGRIALDGTATQSRHAQALTLSLEILREARSRLHHAGEAELVAEDLRRTVGLMDGLVGRIGVEDLLGEIFSSFCIGK